ncbi:MAG: PilZ domain-containing protein [Candidatus Omnitrophica bacterium]|nr:PilZ domain-containing protein [Candidatus Omnitrophota bacterium]
MKEIKKNREHQRLSAYHLVKYRLLSKPQSPLVVASLKDIGGGGLCLRTQEHIPVATYLQLYVNLPQFPQAVTSAAKVMWSRKLKTTNVYEIGLQFVNIEESFRQAIKERVNSTMDRISPAEG